MRQVRLFLFLFSAFSAITCPGSAYAQQITSQYHKGWPSRTGEIDIRKGFADPPKGYGNVPFYWWTGDPLDLDRLTEQLDILADASTDGLNVSYNHTHAAVDTAINAQGHGPCGRVSGGEPRVLSPEWRKIWNEFSKRCAARGIGLGMDDYVIGWPKNGEIVDSIRFGPGFVDYPGHLEKKIILKTDRLSASEMEDLGSLRIVSLRETPDNLGFEAIYTTPAPELHPDFGRRMVEDYFQPFEDNMDAEAREGMNYFFQDELMYYLDIRSWCERMDSIFFARKGYDPLPHLDALFATKDSEVNEEAARFRLDYAEVLTQLAEERYFKPVFDWNAERGLIYGCDPEGRGLRPLQYLDYFRAISWFTAPGNDAPSRGSSFRQTKVSSSIAHLYERPRTWLEAFHSMGWDANGGVLTRQLDHHLIAGGNLLCMHGLYYSTHGGWWEWAPPCFHFRMPYWPHMKYWLKYAERMSFVLSQGVHVCDIAVLYPTETMQAYPEAKADLTFNVAMALSEHGLDYDFIDFQSLQKAVVNKKALEVADERYQVLILAGTRAMHQETLAKVREFIRAGGIVLTVDSAMPGIEASARFQADQTDALVRDIRSRITPDFITSSGRGKVLHRRVGKQDVYMVMDVVSGEDMTFRAKGKVERWDAMHGTITPIDIVNSREGCTTVKYDGPTGNSMLLVFSRGIPQTSEKITDMSVFAQRREVNLQGEWDIEVIPTMDNRWGDFRLPASEGCIGVEARAFHCYPTGMGSSSVEAVYGYAPYMRTVILPPETDLDEMLEHIGPDAPNWTTPYYFSWQYGVFNSPGSQGWHGLKSKVDDRFLILDQGGHQLFAADLDVPADGRYTLFKRGITPWRILIDGQAVSGDSVSLTKGPHSLVLAYKDTRKTAYSLKGMVSRTVDPRDRSMVMLYPEGTPLPEEHGMYDPIVASRWYGTPFVPFVCRKGAGMARFETAPGTVSMAFETAGPIHEILVDGTAVPFRQTGEGVAADGHPVLRYLADRLPEKTGVATVTVTHEAVPDHPGAAFFTEPVKLGCRGGRLAAGDWTGAGALRFFSGGIRYGKDIRIRDKGRRVLLDLGEVDATCEVSVNGKRVDVLLASPYRLDISRYVRRGRNRIEVLVYSSLSNHYQTIPSPYQGTPHAGLIGPVKLIVED